MACELEANEDRSDRIFFPLVTAVSQLAMAKIGKCADCDILIFDYRTRVSSRKRSYLFVLSRHAAIIEIYVCSYRTLHVCVLGRILCAL